MCRAGGADRAALFILNSYSFILSSFVGRGGSAYGSWPCRFSIQRASRSLPVLQASSGPEIGADVQGGTGVPDSVGWHLSLCPTLGGCDSLGQDSRLPSLAAKVKRPEFERGTYRKNAHHRTLKDV
jgi:hypothetical protein